MSGWREVGQNEKTVSVNCETFLSVSASNVAVSHNGQSLHVITNNIRS